MTTIDLKSIRQLLWKPMLCLLIGGATLTGCIDDDEWCTDDNGAGSIIPLGPDEYGIRFALSLDQLGGSAASTRASFGGKEIGDEAENYVNFSTMRILLFDKDDNYVCDLLTETSICNVVDRTPEGSNERHWYVELAVSKLVDAEEGTIGKAIMDCIKDNGFKILTLANWDRRALANRVPDFVAKDDIKGKLSYIAHCSHDETYSAAESDEGVTHSAYEHLRTDDGNMGAYYDWVENHFADANDVANLIHTGKEMRTQGNADSSGGSSLDQSDDWSYLDTSEATVTMYDPKKGFYYIRTERDKAKYEFSNIWYLWNFSNGENCPYPINEEEGEIGYTNQDGDFVSYLKTWESINSGLNDALKNSKTFTDKNKLNTITLKLRSGEFYTPFVSGDPNSDGHVHLESRLNYSKGQSVKERDYSTVVTGQDGCIEIKAETKGTVRIKAKVKNGIGVHTGSDSGAPKWNDENTMILTRNNESRRNFADGKGDGNTIEEYALEVGTSGNSTETVYIFAAGGSVDIYEIEYIKDVYLFNVDRICKQPRVEQQEGIPMYGIQEFDPVGEYWMPGEYFNVSADNGNPDRKKGYHYRYIWMLRSVAKVELKVSKHIAGQEGIRPSSVYMASMNRSSRYEPKDFRAPTDLIWNGCSNDENPGAADYYPIYNQYGLPKNKYYGIPGVENEAENIKKHGAIYEKEFDNKSFAEQGLEYRNFTAWVYGIWTDPDVMDWRWNNMGDEKFGDKVSEIVDAPNGTTGYPYPRIFNDRVWRSNNTRFICDKEKDREEPDYWHYYLYMPEKYIDDSDDAGRRGSDPKVSSIRIRFAYTGDSDNPEDFTYYNNNVNIENSLSYRIYFTDYSDPKHPIHSITDRRKFSSDYEKHTNPVYLDNNWPIIRNSLYRFTLNGLNSGSIITEVYGPDDRNVEIPSFN